MVQSAKNWRRQNASDDLNCPRFGRVCGVDPYAYLADVITKIVNGHPNSRIDDLLLWAYRPAPELKAVA